MVPLVIRAAFFLALRRASARRPTPYIVRLDGRLRGPASARIPAVKRRTLLQALPAAALLSRSLWAAPEQDAAKPAQAMSSVFELRVYHAAPGKLAELLS